MEIEKSLPNSKETELVVLGTLMNDRNAFSEVCDILSEECFYDSFHKKVFKAIKTISDSGERPDTIAVKNHLNDVSPYEIALISSNNTFDIVQHACYLKDLAIRRKFFEVASYLNDNCFSYSEDIENVISKSGEMLSSLLVNTSNNIITIQEGLQKVYDNVSINISGGKNYTGKLTGFRYFDKRSGGLQKSDLVIIAGETSQGKTSFALSIILNMANDKEAIAIYSLEMNALQICSRLTSMESGVSSKEIMYSKLNSYQYEQVNIGIGRIMNTNIYIDEKSTSSLDGILSSIRYMNIKYGVEVFVIDYLQLVSVKGVNGNKEQQTAYLARKLKNTAKDLDVIIIALSQLSRDKVNPVPSLSRLRDSGQIEEASDIVMFVYRPEIYKKSFPEPFDDKETQGFAMIDVAKGRNIGVFSFLCKFDAETTHFIDVHSSEIPNRQLERNNKVTEENIPF